MPSDAVNLPARDVLGRADLTTLELPGDPGELTAYLCGPLPFMRVARGQPLKLGAPACAVHYEVFGSDLWPAREI
jgi:nitric oxide dioxygenase